MAGDYIIIDDMGHRKKLKEYFVNQKIPAEQRNNMWLIAEDNEIIAILGDRSGNSALVSSDTKRSFTNYFLWRKIRWIFQKITIYQCI